MKNKTKDELLKIITELEEKISNLETDVDYWQEEYNAMEEERDNLDNKLADMEIANGVKDINNFIWRLKLDNLYNNDIEEFISIYLDYYN